MKTRKEVVEEIEILEQVMSRSNFYGQVATANMAELKRDDLVDVLNSTNWDMQLADCDHLF